jgi:hypothetical protein
MITWCLSPIYPIRWAIPGQSAYNAVVSGTEAMIGKYDFIDAERIGIQGQSWGGYQITWLLTQTNLFRAAMAGAPVTNMTSAYGGIRWESGVSRIYSTRKPRAGSGEAPGNNLPAM